MNRIYSLLIALIVSNINQINAQTNLVSFGSSWKYMDDGSDQGTAWQSMSFNDSGWSSGNAELGFGDSDENTVVSGGHITYYFRQEFQVSNASIFNSLDIDLTYDDGAVIYVNGVEVDRVNMPTGTIDYQTAASSNSGDNASHNTVVPNNLVQGTNVVCVEVHNRSTGSSDISFDLKLTGSTTSSNVSLERGPYLQLGTPNSMVIKWRTQNPTSSKVMYSTDSSNLNMVVVDSAFTTEHEVELANLNPFTKYYYAIGSLTDTIFGYGDYSNAFYTSKTTGDKSPLRIWALGDAGTANSNQRSVRDAYYNYSNQNYTNVVLQLGDNAYSDGTDSEYQNAMFNNMYEDILRKSVFWSTIGNHDERSVDLNSQTGPYFDIYTFPKNGEAGGLASGTEEYYSFDNGNVHFIVLSSENGDLSSNGTMMTWVDNDINATTQDWIIALWHHPPYSKGSHNSDISSRETQMRQNALPILEAAGIDLVLCGHSHSYERSYFINGHYSFSIFYDTQQHEIDGTSGEHSVDCSYLKTTSGANAGKGAVYAVAGSSGKTSGGSLNHPVMYVGLDELGSMVIDVEDNRMDVRFLRENGNIDDYFTIMKDVQKVETHTPFSGQPLTLEGSWVGDYSWPDGSINKSITHTAVNDTTIVLSDGYCLTDTFIINVTQVPVAIDELTWEELEISPNPVNQGGFVKIKGAQGDLNNLANTMQLRNQLGAEVKIDFSFNGNEMLLGTKNMETGVYYLSSS
ncbi:MAG: metallophosphoesterase family protein, partial [Flavobacteriales bacterium]|nr:metallophosphoesterase family protein [Flavobacteriales bacterium]